MKFQHERPDPTQRYIPGFIRLALAGETGIIEVDLNAESLHFRCLNGYGIVYVRINDRSAPLLQVNHNTVIRERVSRLFLDMSKMQATGHVEILYSARRDFEFHIPNYEMAVTYEAFTGASGYTFKSLPVMIMLTSSGTLAIDSGMVDEQEVQITGLVTGAVLYDVRGYALTSNSTANGVVGYPSGFWRDGLA